jgi:hypothetical protein
VFPFYLLVPLVSPELLAVLPESVELPELLAFLLED